MGSRMDGRDGRQCRPGRRQSAGRRKFAPVTALALGISGYKLDEVDEMSTTAQVKLLQFLQDKQIFALGSDTSIDVDVRVLASTDFGIQQSVSEHRFR